LAQRKVWQFLPRTQRVKGEDLRRQHLGINRPALTEKPPVRERSRWKSQSSQETTLSSCLEQMS
jgi:hypothetical protein